MTVLIEEPFKRAATIKRLVYSSSVATETKNEFQLVASMLM